MRIIIEVADERLETHETKQSITFTLMDALYEFGMARTPAAAYVAKRYADDPESCTAAKVEQVSQRVELSRKLHGSRIFFEPSEPEVAPMPKYPAVPARIDADRTAKPLTSIVHHPPIQWCVGPGTRLIDPEYVGCDGRRKSLMAGVYCRHIDRVNNDAVCYNDASEGSLYCAAHASEHRAPPRRPSLHIGRMNVSGPGAVGIVLGRDDEDNG